MTWCASRELQLGNTSLTWRGECVYRVHREGACALMSENTCYIDGVCYFDFETPRGFHGKQVTDPQSTVT